MVACEWSTLVKTEDAEQLLRELQDLVIRFNESSPEVTPKLFFSLHEHTIGINECATRGLAYDLDVSLPVWNVLNKLAFNSGDVNKNEIAVAYGKAASMKFHAEGVFQNVSALIEEARVFATSYAEKLAGIVMCSEDSLKEVKSLSANSKRLPVEEEIKKEIETRVRVLETVHNCTNLLQRHSEEVLEDSHSRQKLLDQCKREVGMLMPLLEGRRFLQQCEMDMLDPIGRKFLEFSWNLSAGYLYYILFLYCSIHLCEIR